MGTQTEHRCQACGTSFEIQEGGGFFFDLLHCDRCGRGRAIGHDEMGDIHLGYVKGLDGPYSIVRAESDERIRQEYPGAALTESEYRTEVEQLAGSCDCGGSFRYDAPSRCPGCGSTREQWSDASRMIIYD